MDFGDIIASINAYGPAMAFIGAGALVALACCVEFVGKTLARFWTGRIFRGRL